MHFDIEVPDIDTEAAPPRRARRDTGERKPRAAEHGSTWLLMADPEGNEFCVCDAGQPDPA